MVSFIDLAQGYRIRDPADIPVVQKLLFGFDIAIGYESVKFPLDARCEPSFEDDQIEISLQMPQTQSSFPAYQFLEIGMQGIDIGYVPAVPCLVIAFRQRRTPEMIIPAVLSDGRGVIGYDPAALIVTVDMQFILL